MSESRLLGRRSLMWAGAAGATLAGAYLVWGPSDQRRVLALLRELLSSANALPGDSDLSRRRRVESALGRLTFSDLSMSAPELGVLEGHAAVLSLLETADGVSIDIRIEQSDVRVSREAADATLLVGLTFTALGEGRRQVRTVSAQLRRVRDGFRVARIAASGASHEQPEARP
jgi:hypothetical protein